MSEKIAYIDEDSTQRSDFYRYIDQSSSDSFSLEVIPLEPDFDLDKLLKNILDSKCSAIVSDEKLGTNASRIVYSGHDIVDKWKERYRDFPCFILTSYASDVITEIDDANYIYEKKRVYGESDVSNNKPILTFFERLRLAITSYNRKLSDATNGLRKLQLKEVLNSEEKKLLISHNDFVTRNMGVNYNSIAVETVLNLGLQDLVCEMKELLEEMRGGKSDETTSSR